MSDLIAVQYVGHKPFAIDNVAGSKKLWNGHGNVQEVTTAQARTLLKYPDQWALVDQSLADSVAQAPAVVVQEDGEDVPVHPDALDKPLEKMSKTELIAFAQHTFGKELPATLGKKAMVDQIEEWQTLGV